MSERALSKSTASSALLELVLHVDAVALKIKTFHISEASDIFAGFRGFKFSRFWVKNMHINFRGF